MHAFKETCALHCLLALYIAGPLPVTQQVVIDITGFEDAAVRKGLQKLLVLGLVTCTGDKHRTAWQVTCAAHTLPLPIEHLLSIPATLESPFSQEEELIPITINSLYIDSSCDPAPTPVQPAPLESNALAPAGFAKDLQAIPIEHNAAAAAAFAIDRQPIPLEHESAASVQSANDQQPAPMENNSAVFALSAKNRRLAPIEHESAAAIKPANDQPAAPLEHKAAATRSPKDHRPAPIEPNAAATAAPAPSSQPAAPPAQSTSAPAASHRDPAPPPAPPPLGVPDRPDSPTLRAHFYAAFEAANVWLQLRRPLADALLAEDGPGWLTQSLGWLCYAARRLPHVQRGAVLFISLRDRLPCDDAYLPPPDLPFAAALAWALRGGEDEQPPETAEAGLDLHPAEAPAPEPETPEAKLWQSVLHRLSLELPRGMLEARLRDVRLLSLTAGACTIAAPSPQARDWLANRLSAVLARTLKDLTGSDLEVQIKTMPPAG